MQNNIKILLVVLFLLAGISFFVLKNNQTHDEAWKNAKFIPSLAEQINNIDAIAMKKASQTITLSKDNGIWHLAEKNNYIADANKIADTLLELRKLTIKNKKTSNAEKYQHLGLSQEGTNPATFITLKSNGKIIADVVIGKLAARSLGVFAKHHEQKQSYLLEGQMQLNLDVSEWMVSQLFNINAEKVKSVSYAPAQAQAFTIAKSTEDEKDFSLLNMPENKQLKGTVALKNLANGLVNFSIDDVVARSTVGADELVNQISYTLFSGEEYLLKIFKKDEKYYLTLKVANLSDNSVFAKNIEKWLFVIPKYKFEALNKRLDDVLEDKKEDKNKKAAP